MQNTACGARPSTTSGQASPSPSARRAVALARLNRSPGPGKRGLVGSVQEDRPAVAKQLVEILGLGVFGGLRVVGRPGVHRGLEHGRLELLPDRFDVLVRYHGDA